jgi:cytochrome bd-type quinol oxidase subunit 2
MLGVALVFVPIVIAYQIWVYRFFGMRGEKAAEVRTVKLEG